MKLYDPVHGFIHFNDFETLLIDSKPFQRLRYIHQLGVTYIVYPGATHTRFEHSLGTMHLATQIFDQIALEKDQSYWRQIVRLAALCHDLGHLPFSHVAEKILLGEEGHESWTFKMIFSSYLASIWKEVESRFESSTVALDVAKLSLGPQKLKQIDPQITFTPLEAIYSQIVTGDFFGADRIDYLLRDARATGLNYGLFDYKQLIEMLTLIEDDDKGWIFGVEENGIASCEALLLARHFMQRRVYQYATARAYSFHMARLMTIFYRNPSYFDSIEGFLQMSEFDLLSQIEKAKDDPAHLAHFHAQALSDRDKKFQAIDLPPWVEEEQLLSYQKKVSAPASHIYWDLKGENVQGVEGLDLPLLLKNQTKANAKDFSKIQIPKPKQNWLYLAPEYEFAL